MRKAEIKMNEVTAGWLTQDEDGYHFLYDEAYLNGKQPEPISFTLPLKETAYTGKVLFNPYNADLSLLTMSC
jgi:serine/threonine-protein kinase HipA